MGQYLKNIITPTLLCGTFVAMNAQAFNGPLLAGVYAGGGVGYQAVIEPLAVPETESLSSEPVLSVEASPIPFLPESPALPEETVEEVGPMAEEVPAPPAPVLSGVYAGGGLGYPNVIDSNFVPKNKKTVPPLLKNTSGKNALTGWFVGGGLGWQHLSSNGSSSMIQGGPAATDKIKPSGNGIVGEVHGGGSGISNGLYYGGKLFLDTSSTNAKDITRTIATDGGIPLDMTNQVKLSKKYGVGLTGQVGVSVGPKKALYGILGITLAKFQVKYAELSDNATGKQNKTLVGMPFGLGFAYAMSESVRVFSEGTYTIYQSFTTKNLNTLNGTDSYKAKIAPQEFNLIMGVSYTF